VEHYHSEERREEGSRGSMVRKLLLIVRYIADIRRSKHHHRGLDEGTRTTGKERHIS
jgi:hypothetical protein